MEKTNIFKCKPPEVHFTITNRVPYNKLLTNLACSSRTGEYWPSVVFVRTSLRSVRTAATSGQYSPVRPPRSVSKRLIFHVVALCSLLLCVSNIPSVSCPHFSREKKTKIAVDPLRLRWLEMKTDAQLRHLVLH